jgi:hypothetical protein
LKNVLTQIIPRSRFWRIVFVIAILAFTYILAVFLIGYGVRHGPHAAHAADICPLVSPNGNDTGIRIMYQGQCTPLMSTGIPYLPATSGMFPAAALVQGPDANAVRLR